MHHLAAISPSRGTLTPCITPSINNQPRRPISLPHARAVGVRQPPTAVFLFHVLACTYSGFPPPFLSMSLLHDSSDTSFYPSFILMCPCCSTTGSSFVLILNSHAVVRYLTEYIPTTPLPLPSTRLTTAKWKDFSDVLPPRCAFSPVICPFFNPTSLQMSRKPAQSHHISHMEQVRASMSLRAALGIEAHLTLTRQVRQGVGVCIVSGRAAMAGGHRHSPACICRRSPHRFAGHICVAGRQRDGVGSGITTADRLRDGLRASLAGRPDGSEAGIDPAFDGGGCCCCWRWRGCVHADARASGAAEG